LRAVVVAACLKLPAAICDAALLAALVDDWRESPFETPLAAFWEPPVDENACRATTETEGVLREAAAPDCLACPKEVWDGVFRDATDDACLKFPVTGCEAALLATIAEDCRALPELAADAALLAALAAPWRTFDVTELLYCSTVDPPRRNGRNGRERDRGRKTDTAALRLYPGFIPPR
jgi:hypothetical protein